MAKKKKVRVIGSLSDYLQDKIKEVVPKLDRDDPIVIIGKESTGKANNLIRLMDDDELDDKLLQEDEERTGVRASSQITNTFWMVTDRNKMSITNFSTLESYCKIRDFRLFSSDEEVAKALEDLIPQGE